MPFLYCEARSPCALRARFYTKIARVRATSLDRATTTATVPPCLPASGRCGLRQNSSSQLFWVLTVREAIGTSDARTPLPHGHVGTSLGMAGGSKPSSPGIRRSSCVSQRTYSSSKSVEAHAVPCNVAIELPGCHNGAGSPSAIADAIANGEWL